MHVPMMNVYPFLTHLLYIARGTPSLPKAFHNHSFNLDIKATVRKFVSVKISMLSLAHLGVVGQFEVLENEKLICGCAGG